MIINQHHYSLILYFFNSLAHIGQGCAISILPYLYLPIYILHFLSIDLSLTLSIASFSA